MTKGFLQSPKKSITMEKSDSKISFDYLSSKLEVVRAIKSVPDVFLYTVSLRITDEFYVDILVHSQSFLNS